ncbi:MFS general substrate transporter [Aspergillus steynii IBT 23096]|uniref:MFS general substrate transporter n=1 Tax=Aspergillus steynii IBT 23096 TaxID=1392250 RepID=A0A2I2FX66_9EURO|nr:MFS general substrate transporter [Aspergillus steynii IBT 23096]PLB45224.1 MFS general substrate transporter [Aspergillus steynii IBT 23096]
MASPDVDIGQIKAASNEEVDPALQLTQGEVIEYTPDEERRVLRKINMTILPLMCWVYMLQYADKSTLNYASLMGIRTDTKLTGDNYNWVSSIFYAGYLAWEIPTTYLFRRLPVGKYASFNILCWGIVLSCHAAAFDYSGLLAARFFLGFFEATVTPAFVLITSMWFKQNEQAKRMGFWLSCNGVALILMAVVAYGLSAVTDAALASWRILFLILGPLTAVTGAVYVWLLPDSQVNAWFLNERERLIAIERIRNNFQGIGSQVWKWDQFLEAFQDPRTYCYLVFSFLMNIPSGGITTFGSIIINSFGFNERLSLLLGAPSGVFDIGGKLLFTWLSDKYLDRTLFAFLAILIPLVGGIMMIAIPLSAPGGLLLGYYLISVAGASWGLIMAAISNNTLGYTKKVTVSGLQIIAYAAGNWVGPQAFRANDAPIYLHGKIVVAVMYGASAVVLVALRWVNIRENRRRDRLLAENPVDVDDPEVVAAIEREKFLDLTDFHKPHFRYVL